LLGTVARERSEVWPVTPITGFFEEPFDLFTLKGLGFFGFMTILGGSAPIN
jgi:hypothetical protein